MDTYLIGFLVFKETPTEGIVYRHGMAPINAESRPEAENLAKKWLLSKAPPFDGWYGHDIMLSGTVQLTDNIEYVYGLDKKSKIV